MKKVTSVLFVSIFAFVPAFAFAGFGEIDTFAGNIVAFINGTLIPLVFALALLLFIWGMFTYFILGGGDETKREQGKSLMLWAIIGFVMMIIIFGLVNLLASGLLQGMGGASNEGIEKLPKGPDVQGG